MNSLQHLLVATDLSAPSLLAVDRGFLLAKARDARLTLFHALAIDTPEEFRQLLGDRLPAVWQRLEQEAEASLKHLLADSSRNPGVAAEIRVERGLPFRLLPACAGSCGADLVLIGAQGEGLFQKLLLGSTASRLLRKSRCPVLVVKRPAGKPYRRVLVSIDFSPASEIAIRTARAIAPEAELVLLHVFEAPFERKMHFAGVDEHVFEQYRNDARQRADRQMEELVKASGLSATKFTTKVLHGNPYSEILGEERKFRHDLIVMGKHGTHLTEELLLGSLTKRVLAQSRSDVLVVLDERPPRFEPD